jgi:hypothetical protein
LRLPRLLRVALVALALLPAGRADALPAITLPANTGLAEAAGIARTPDGALWVSDGASGVCRATLVPPALVQDGTWCSSVTASVRAPGQMAFDAQTSSFYVADGSSTAGGIWRLHWNAVTGAIDDGAMLVRTPNDRVLGLALSPTGPPTSAGGPASAELDFSTKRASAIQRVVDPAGTPSVETVGTALHAGTPSLAHLGAALYLAEPTGVTVIAAPGSAAPEAKPVPRFPGGVPTALAVDGARGRVYAGTKNGNSQDQVDVLTPSTGAVETYQDGFAGVTALADDGDVLLVADDPAASAGAIGTAGGRVWSVPLAALGRPRTTIDLAPASITRATSATFAFSAPSAAVFECRLDSQTWAPCGGQGSGTRTYGTVVEGIHVFEVRAVDVDPLIGAGEPTRATFVVDRTAPSVTVDNVRQTFLVGLPVEIAFSSTEPNVDYACRLDGAPPEPCGPPHALTSLARGAHTLAVTAVDLAGNSSDPRDPAATAAFSVIEPPPPPPPASVADPVAAAQPSAAAPGLSSLAAEPAGSAAPGPRQTRPSCAGQPSAAAGFRAGWTRVSRRRLQFGGWALGTACAGAVRVAIAQLRSGASAATACRFLSRNGVLGLPRSCGAPVYLRVRRVGASWTLTVRAACCSALPSGTYVAAAVQTPLGDGPPMTPAPVRFRVR